MANIQNCTSSEPCLIIIQALLPFTQGGCLGIDLRDLHHDLRIDYVLANLCQSLQRPFHD